MITRHKAGVLVDKQTVHHVSSVNISLSVNDTDE